MKKALTTFLYISAVILSGSLLTSCQAIGDIFGAGVYVGMFLVIVVVIVIIIIITRLNKK